ncbi:PGA52-like protein [Colletotrichum gloeosporioides]|uniref:glucan endo-1,3-beta-D-glucosidase n=1 Tax=Colletotrichum gloeosporioides TaxID=474922 RepID=A0A8H4CFM7_COLGL|nr:PGA52-like protein [Colletotrichum gloeosporioides]KAF3802921.1 PGA52-like protein [Colletotrichum gloeosporioides]
MKPSTAVLLASASVAQALQQCSSGTATEEGGNWWCGVVEQILYSNVGHPGTYKAVSNMGEDGSCSFEDVAFSGPLAPFNEELTPLFRGPMNLKQVAVYNLKSSAKRSPAVSHTHARRHGHHHLHKKHAEAHDNKEEKRGNVWVTATIDGIVQSWINNWNPAATPNVAPVANTPAVAPIVAPTPTPAAVSQPPVVAAAAASKPSSSSKASPSKASTSTGSSSGEYSRVAYYNADQGVADGLVFLGNYGGQGSGKFDNVFGNSLSYLNSDASGGAASPEVLNPVYLPSNKEFAIYSDKECTDGSCGYYRPGSVAYHGFKGEDSVWLFEFNMPMDGTAGFNADMPALWFLNAKIPRTAQYNSCSCWPACGELDIFEVLAAGDTKCKSTFHSNVPGGSSDYFDRPTGEPIKVATVLDGDSGQVSVKVLDSSVDFSAGLTREQVEGWLSTTSIASTSGNNKVSLFALSS